MWPCSFARRISAAAPCAELARALRAVTAAAGAGLYVNDRVDVALAVGADGVHLGGGSLDAGTAAGIAPGLAIAVSVHAPAEVAALRAAAGDRIAFALLGPIRDTPSKRRYGAPLATPPSPGRHGPGSRSSRSAASSRRTCARCARRARTASLASARSWPRPTRRRREAFCKELN